MADTFNSDVAVDSEGNVCTIGWFSGPANFDPLDMTNQQGILAQGTDGFISKLSGDDGAYIFGGPFTGTSNNIKPHTIVAGMNGSIYIGGIFAGSVDFDASDAEHLLLGSGESGFLIKMNDLAASAPTLLEVSALNAYPNPSTGKFTIQSTIDLKNQNIFVYNQLGQKVNVRTAQSANEMTLQIDGAKGIYFLEIRGEDGSRSTAKLLKE